MTFQSVIVNQEGLTPFQVEVLEILEADFFKDVVLDYDRMKEIKAQFEAKGSYNGKELLEVCDFFRFVNKPMVKGSYKDPADISDYFEVVDKRTNGSRWFYTKDPGEYTSLYVLESDKLKDVVSPIITSWGYDHYYEMFDCNLYIKANKILASRFVAVVKYKPAFFKEVACQ